MNRWYITLTHPRCHKEKPLAEVTGFVHGKVKVLLRMVKMTTFYFTATGNSLYVAKTIGGKLHSIPQLMKDGQFNFEDTVIGFVFPIYGLTLPRIVRKFLKKINFRANYTFAIGTYGNMDGSCMYNLVKYFKKKGLVLNYADSVKMADNYLPMFEMNDQINKLNTEKINKKLNSVINNINNKINYVSYPGIFKLILTNIILSYSARFFNGKSAQKYIVNENCNNCGICVKVCPTGNIDIKDKVIFNINCETCYSCIQNCPKNAIHLKNEKSGARFRNENVSINEIIQANCQK